MPLFLWLSNFIGHTVLEELDCRNTQLQDYSRWRSQQPCRHALDVLGVETMASKRSNTASVQSWVNLSKDDVSTKLKHLKQDKIYIYGPKARPNRTQYFMEAVRSTSMPENSKQRERASKRLMGDTSSLTDLETVALENRRLQLDAFVKARLVLSNRQNEYHLRVVEYVHQNRDRS